MQVGSLPQLVSLEVLCSGLAEPGFDAWSEEVVQNQSVDYDGEYASRVSHKRYDRNYDADDIENNVDCPSQTASLP